MSTYKVWNVVTNEELTYMVDNAQIAVTLAHLQSSGRYSLYNWERDYRNQRIDIGCYSVAIGDWVCSKTPQSIAPITS